MALVTPIGFRDILGDEAKERESIRRDAQDLFDAHGFNPIETPTLEAMDVLKMGRHIPSSPFRFFDSRGDLLAMRPDVTLQVARMCATRLGKDANATRLRYTQRVFRDDDAQTTSGAREITQIGIENIGESGADVDRELVSLLIEALQRAGVKELVVTLATVEPLNALLERSDGDDAWCDAVLDAFHSSDFVELDRLCDLENYSDIGPAYADAISKLARVRGQKDAIAAAKELLSPLGCTDGLDALEQVVKSVSATYSDVSILVDFSVMSSFDYYTGIVFEVYSPYLGQSIGSGGRYDDLLSTFGVDRKAAGFAFCLEQVMAAKAAEDSIASKVEDSTASKAEDSAASSAPAVKERPARKLRIAVPKGALHKDAVAVLADAGLDVSPLADLGRQLTVSTDDVEYIIVRPSDAPSFVSYGAADCGICGRDSLLEAQKPVVELVDLSFGACKFVVAEPEGTRAQVEERYRRLGSMRIATKYPSITLAHFAKTGIQVDIVHLNGNIELAPLTGMAERIVDITATGNTLRENHLEIVEDVLPSTARFFANVCSMRTDDRVVELARRLSSVTAGKTFDPIAGKSF